MCTLVLNYFSYENLTIRHNCSLFTWSHCKQQYRVCYDRYVLHCCHSHIYFTWSCPCHRKHPN